MLDITIRMNAAEDAVTINGNAFDRSALDKNQRWAMAQLVRDTWAKHHKIPFSKSRKTRSRNRKKVR